jgi:hypothetical protein
MGNDVNGLFMLPRSGKTGMIPVFFHENRIPGLQELLTIGFY